MDMVRILKSTALITLICSIFLLFACPDLLLAIIVGLIMFI